MKLLLSILIILFSTWIHELGHFTLAKLNEVKVEEFDIGCGKSLIQIKTNDIIYSLRLIPFGGYCKLDVKSFNLLKNKTKIKIMLGGVVGNFFLCLISLWVILQFKQNGMNMDVINELHFEGLSIIGLYKSMVANFSLNSLTFQQYIVVLLYQLYIVNFAMCIFNIIPITSLD